MKKLLPMLLATLALSGCLTTPTPVESLADELIESGLVLDAVVADTFSDQELDIVLKAVEDYKKFHARYVVDPSPSYIEVAVAFANLRGNYKVVERIVSDHWDEYPASVQHELKFYREEAKLYDKTIQAKIKAGKTAEAFQTAVKLGQLVVKVIAL
ncbi:MAG: hypothetical protein GY776_08815 [Alteromonas sp.]|nr:hypothetical protein [Alteromonas sp.]